MENAAKALTIAGNVLLAVIILSLVTYFYNTWRRIPLEEEAALLVEQAQEFNKQYEVFDKKLMYGVDVLSCVNKAISNNAKYVTGSDKWGDKNAGWLSGTLSSTEFAIEVEVILKEPLQEQIDVYYHKYSTTSSFDPSTNTTIYDSSYKEQKEFGDRGTEGASNISFRDLAGLNTTRPKFKIPSDAYVEQMYSNEHGLSDWDDVKLKTQTINLVTDLGEFEDDDGPYYRYTLLHGKYDKNVIDEDNVFLKKLIETISTFTTSDSQIIYNNDDSTLTKWSKIEWVPAVSAFKNKKFRCEGVNSDGEPNGTPGIQYNEETGAINKLTFVEYTIPSE